MRNIVITISRQYGSGGKTIGAMLAKELGINCYSREILRMASEDSGINGKTVWYVGRKGAQGRMV